MNNQPTPEDERLSALYQQTPRDEPSAQMDASIRKLAHNAVRKSWITLPRMAIAASVLLMLSVGVQVYYEPVPEIDFSPPPAQPSIQEKARPQAGSAQQRAYAPAMSLSADQERVETAPRKRLKQTPEQDCQVPDSLVSQSTQVWQRYIQNLREANQQAEADCLQKLAPEK